MKRVLLLHATREAQDHWMVKRLLRRSGLQREQFIEANLEQLREQGDERQGLLALTRQANVGVVVPLGEDPLYSLLGTSELLRWFHRAVPHSDFGWVLPNFAPHKLLPYRADDADEWEEEEGTGKRWKKKAKGLRHPPRFTGVVGATLHKALRIAREGLPEAPKPLYQCDPPPGVYAKWIEEYERELTKDPDLILSHDCETSYHLKGQGDEDADLGIDQDKRIIRSSFAFRGPDGVIYSVSVPHDGPYVALTRRLLQSPGPKLGWNSWTFDEPVWELNGEELKGRHYDGQDAWHLLQSDLDKGLEFVSAFYTRLLPWKHTAQSTADLYAAIDAYAALENFLGIRADLKQAGQWELYEKHAVDLHPILRRASKRGVMIDLQLRAELREEFRAKLKELLWDAQGMVPTERKRFHPYVRVPKNATGSWSEVTVLAKRRICNACGRKNINRKHACKVDPEGWKTDYTKMLGSVAEEQIRHINTAPSMDGSLEDLEKWLKKNGFNPNSSKQLIAYMKAYRHPVGVNWKTDEESADNKHLKKLAKQYGQQHPIYPQTMEVHLVQKALSQYIEGVSLDARNCTSTTYGNAPSTWRLNSSRMNLQNVSKRETNPYAAKARRMFIARTEELAHAA